jgi:hypothetical protein
VRGRLALFPFGIASGLHAVYREPHLDMILGGVLKIKLLENKSKIIP